MHNWRLLLLAFLAFLEPIASFKHSLVDGREQRCERDFRNEERSYGTRRFSKTSPDVRRVNLQAIRGDIRYDARSDSVLGRNSVERRVREYRLESERERRSTFRAGISEERREFKRYASRVTNRDNQNQDISRIRKERASVSQDDIRNRAVTFQQSPNRLLRSEIQRDARISEAARSNTASPREIQENRQIHFTLLQARDNLAEPRMRVESFRSRVLEGRRDFTDPKFRLDASEMRVHRAREISRSSELDPVRRQMDLRSGHSERRDLRTKSDEGRVTTLRDKRISAERLERRLSQSGIDQRRSEDVRRRSVIRSERNINERSSSRIERSVERRQFHSQRDTGAATERRALFSPSQKTSERRSIEREERRDTRRDSSVERRASKHRTSSESRLSRDWEFRSESRNARQMSRRSNEERNTRSDERFTANRALDRSNRPSAERAMERERQFREHREGEIRTRGFRTITSRDLAEQLRLIRLQSRERAAIPERYLQNRDERVERLIRRDFKNDLNVQDSRRYTRASQLREETSRSANAVLERRERSDYQESLRNLRQVSPSRFEYSITKNNLERENVRYSNIEFSRRMFSVREKTQPDDQAPMNWQYLLYTLQGIYICGILVQLLSANESGKKSRAFTWWTGSSQNLIKVD